MPTDQPHIEQCVGRAIASGRPLGATPVHPVDDFAGYGWYDALPRALGYSFRIERGEGDVLDYAADTRSEEHTSELQSLMRISYAVFCSTQKKTTHGQPYHNTTLPSHTQA